MDPQTARTDDPELNELNQKITDCLHRIRGISSAHVELGGHLRQVRDRALHKRAGYKRFYAWTKEVHGIDKTQALKYLKVGEVLTPAQVAGLELALDALHEIAQAPAVLLKTLLDLARDIKKKKNKGPVVFKRCRLAGEEVLAAGGTLDEAIEAVLKALHPSALRDIVQKMRGSAGQVTRRTDELEALVREGGTFDKKEVRGVIEVLTRDRDRLLEILTAAEGPEVVESKVEPEAQKEAPVPKPEIIDAEIVRPAGPGPATAQPPTATAAPTTAAVIIPIVASNTPIGLKEFRILTVSADVPEMGPEAEWLEMLARLQHWPESSLRPLVSADLRERMDRISHFGQRAMQAMEALNECADDNLRRFLMEKLARDDTMSLAEAAIDALGDFRYCLNQEQVRGQLDHWVELELARACSHAADDESALEYAERIAGRYELPEYMRACAAALRAAVCISLGRDYEAEDHMIMAYEYWKGGPNVMGAAHRQYLWDFIQSFDGDIAWEADVQAARDELRRVLLPEEAPDGAGASSKTAAAPR